MKKAVTTDMRAAASLISWCNATGIPCEVQRGKDSHLCVTAKSGTAIDVLLTDADVQTAGNKITVKLSDVLNPDMQVGLSAFHSITERAGYGKPVPVDRGEEIKGRRLNQVDDFDLIALRHKEFRAAPNLPASEYAPFEQVIRNNTRSFFRKNYGMCKEYGLEVDDLRTYALGWTTNFLHKYKLPWGQEDENKKLLHTHLRQRFAELARNLHEKKAHCIPDQEGYNIATTGNVDGEAEAEPVDLEYVSRHKKIDTRNAQKRRESSRKLLMDSLASLPHDRMVGLLTEAVANRHIDQDAREEAEYRLKEHKKSCSQCNASSEVKEDGASVNALCA